MEIFRKVYGADPLIGYSCGDQTKVLKLWTRSSSFEVDSWCGIPFCSAIFVDFFILFAIELIALSGIDELQVTSIRNSGEL